MHTYRAIITIEFSSDCPRRFSDCLHPLMRNFHNFIKAISVLIRWIWILILGQTADPIATSCQIFSFQLSWIEWLLLEGLFFIAYTHLHTHPPNDAFSFLNFFSTNTQRTGNNECSRLKAAKLELKSFRKDAVSRRRHNTRTQNKNSRKMSRKQSKLASFLLLYFGSNVLMAFCQFSSHSTEQVTNEIYYPFKEIISFQRLRQSAVVARSFMSTFARSEMAQTFNDNAV